MSPTSSDDDLTGFQAVVWWQGQEMFTLADVPPKKGGIVLIGINPSPTSVNLGHYYQGTLGKRVWTRLGAIGLLTNEAGAWEDEAWQRAGNGLSDVVKRPTSGAAEISEDEFAAGAEALRRELLGWKPGLIVFSFLASAKAVHGHEPPVGQGPDMDGVTTFRMEGPYAASANVDRNGRELAELVGGKGTARASAAKVAPASEVPDRPPPPTRQDALTQPVTAADKAAGRIRLPRPAKHFFPASRSTVTVVLRGMRHEARYDPRTGPEKERSAVLSIDRQALMGIDESRRLRVSIRPTDGVISLD